MQPVSSLSDEKASPTALAAPSMHDNEAERMAALRALCVLDTPADGELDRLVEIVRLTFNAPIAVVSLVDEDRLWFLARAGITISQTPRKETFCDYAIHSSEPTIVPDTRLDARFADHPMVTTSPYVRFYAGAPLTARGGHRLGTLCLLDWRPNGQFSAHSAALLTQMAALATLRIETMRKHGYTDTLTALPNRSRFIDDLDRRSAAPDGPHPSGTTAVAVDVCGPGYGRDLVKAIGQAHLGGYLLAAKERLLTALPAGTALYRITATYFGLLVPTGDGHDDIVESVLSAFGQTIDHDGIPHCADVSIGVVNVAPEQAGDDVYRALLMVTDDVRDRQRQCGVFDPAHDFGHQRAFRLLTALTGAMTVPDELNLHYQPRVRLSDGCCVGAEALLRWRHPVLGSVGPNEFIPLAEKTALIGRLTDWVLRAALTEAARWQRAGRGLNVSINVSATDLDRSDFVDTVARELSLSGVDPQQIEIEFTESAIVRDMATMQSRLEQIRALGLQLAIDDFGIGYSNLAYLKRIPATTLKIDQSFVRKLPDDATDRAIVPAIIGLAQSLGLRIVAEGIETEAAFDCLRGWGCDEGQGYWIARPMPVAHFETWLASGQRPPSPAP